MSRCCSEYVYDLCLIANQEQTYEQDDFEVTVEAGTIYAPTLEAANCLALEVAEDRVRDEICENSEPIADDQNLETPFDTPLDIVLTGSSPFGGPLIFTVTTLPTNGILIGSGDTWTYTPTPGYSGPDSFQFTVFDGGNESAPGTISITVLAPELGCIQLNICGGTEERCLDCEQIEGEEVVVIVNGVLGSFKEVECPS